jgi:undecaprenyl-diphosphatase
VFSEIIHLDRLLFQLLNDVHSELFDLIMYWVSYKFTWIPLYLLLLFLLINQYRKKSIFIIIALALMIPATDQGCNFFKHTVKRPRPCREEAELIPKGRILQDYNCSKYGFFSAHAANSFAVAFLVTALLSKWHKRIGWFLYPWALVTAYSRIYLGVHYPLDIICGMIYGLVVAWIILKLLRYLPVLLNQKDTSKHH